MTRILAFLLVCLTASVGCNQSNNAEVAKVKAGALRVEAEAAKADLVKSATEVVTLQSELARLKTAKPEPAKQPVVDAERKAAEWVVQSGGVVRISANGVIGEYPKDGHLPEGEFRVITVDLREPAQKGGLSNEGVESLAGLKHLNSLTLPGGGSMPGVTDFSFLNGLESLEYLDLNGSGITDAGLAHIRGLAKLKVLNVEHFFGNREITDVGLENLKDLKNLELLWLWGANITDAGLDNIRGLTKLWMLRLGRTTGLTDAALTYLKGLSELRELHLVETQVTDSGLETLKGLSKLELLNLESTKVTDAGVKAFNIAIPKCKIVGMK